jgi:LPXTG-site transpeptidase (sortase) family protein
MGTLMPSHFKFPALCVAVAILIVLPVMPKEEALVVPTVEAAEPSTFPEADVALPTRISIPSIKLNSPIEEMGINSRGELDVPSGKTNIVGWYKDGTIPGQLGSAVLDAHVYAALRNLHSTKVGSDIYITMSNGTTLHYKITEKKTQPLSQVSADELFNRASGKELHLITCAGTFIKKLNTYDKRLLVYATLVE